jgi:hypothetical protein
MEPFDIADLFPGRDEPIPRATADDELYVIKSNPTHIKWGEPRNDGSFYSHHASYHIGYQTKFGSVALCGVGNDKIPTGCRCAPWHPKPGRTETDCADCLNIAKSLHFEGKYPDGVE